MHYTKLLSTAIIMLSLMCLSGHALEKLGSRAVSMARALGPNVVLPTARSFSSMPVKDNEGFFRTLRDAETAISTLPTDDLQSLAQRIVSLASCLETYKRRHPQSIFWNRGTDEQVSTLELNWFYERQKCPSMATEEENLAIKKVNLLMTALWEDQYGPM